MKKPKKYNKTAVANKVSEDSTAYFQSESIVIINENFLSTRKIKECSIDLIVTSPPYNVDIHYNFYDDTISYDNYLDFTEQWLKKAYSVLKDDGRICLNIPLDKNKGGQQSVGADITTIAKKSVSYITQQLYGTKEISHVVLPGVRLCLLQHLMLLHL